MQFTAQQIATLINGKVEGNPDTKVSKVAKIEDASEGDLSFVANPKYEDYLYKSEAALIIVNESLEIKNNVSATLIRVKDAYGSFALLLEKYSELLSNGSKRGIDKTAVIASNAQISEEAYIGALCVIGENVKVGTGAQIHSGSILGDNVIVGDNTTLHNGVKIYDNCEVGNNVIIHSGVVLGSDGFGFAPQKDKSYKKIPQIGNVVIEDNVEIGANTTIDRATMGSTIIRKGVKLDNLIQIAHNVEIGENTVIAAQTGVSGSTKIGRNCIIGGQVGIVGHITIADNTSINAQSGVSKTVSEPNRAFTGSPAFDYKSSLKSQAIFRNLPELQQRLSILEQTVAELTAMLNNKTTNKK